jgi:hypothetical protein
MLAILVLPFLILNVLGEVRTLSLLGAEVFSQLVVFF